MNSAQAVCGGRHKTLITWHTVLVPEFRGLYMHALALQPFQRPADSLLVAERRPACSCTIMQAGLVQLQSRNLGQTDLVLAIAIGVPKRCRCRIRRIMRAT